MSTHISSSVSTDPQGRVRRSALRLLLFSLGTTVVVSGPVLAQQPDPSAKRVGSVDAVGAPTRLIKRITISGNTVIPSDQLAPIIAPYENRAVSVAELKELAAKITELYHKRGYIIARAIVPRKQPGLESGELSLVVYEGRIGKVVVTGNKQYSKSLVEAYVKEGTEGGRLKGDRFARALLLLNELPDMSAKAVLKPSTEPGAADVVVQVVDKSPVHGGFDYNNFGVVATGTNRAGLTVEAGNLTGNGDNVTLRGVVGFPSKNTNFYQADYVLPVDHNGTRLHVDYASGAFAVGSNLQSLGIRGRSSVVTLGGIVATNRTFDNSTDAWVELANKDVHNSYLGSTLSHDHYTMVNLGVSSTFRDADGQTLLRGNIGQGLGGNATGDPLASVPGSTSSFTKLNVDAGRVQRIAPQTYFVIRGSGQIGFQPLYIVERYPVGGVDSVRGYQYGEYLGDSAYVVSGELRYSPFKENEDALQLVGFVDNGAAYVKNAPRGFKSSETLTGAGVGLRSTLSENVKLRLDIGFPLSPPNVQRSSPVFYLQLATRF